jgi:ribosome biogenesis GTPase
VIGVSAQEATGLADLLERCSGKTLVLVGESGAGKSTLVNALVGRMGAATGSVRAGDHKGRHTTTSRQLYVLPNDCRLIDTPGMREVGLATDAETIEQGFDDIAVLAENCRFRDCEHDAEPGCAVRAAIELGDLPESRLRRWAEFREEARGAELRADVAARRKEDRRKGRIVHEAQRLKRGRRTR